MRIIRTLNTCEQVLDNSMTNKLDTIRSQANELRRTIDRQMIVVHDKLDQYRQELNDLLTKQETTHALNS
jgi:hypothetical protein